MCDFSLRNYLLLAFIGISNLSIVLWWLSASGPIGRIKSLISSNFWAIFALVGGLSLSVWAAVYVFYGLAATGDLKVFYEQAQMALSGRLVGLHTWSAYMPLFDYLTAIPLLLWGHVASISLFITVCYTLIGLVIIRVAREIKFEKQVGNSLAVVGLLNGAGWFLAIGYAQDEVFMVLFFLLGVLLMLRGRQFKAGVLFGLGLVATKLTFLLLILSAISVIKRPFKFAAGVAAISIPTMAAFIWLGFDPSKMLGSNLLAFTPPSLTTLFGAPWYKEIIAHAGIVHFLTILWCVAVAGLAYRYLSGQFSAIKLLNVTVALWLGYVLITTKSLSMYRLVILPLLPIAIAEWRIGRKPLIWLFGLYSTALGSQFIFYEDLISGQGPYYRFFVDHLTSTECLASLSFVLFLDVVIVGSEMIWVFFSLRRIVGRGGGVPKESDSSRLKREVGATG
jgi:hypothetical protein